METANAGSAQETFSKRIAGAKEAVKNVGDQLADTAESAYSDAKESGKQMYDACAEQGARQLKSLESIVKDYPIASVLTAIGAGVLLSRLCK